MMLSSSCDYGRLGAAGRYLHSSDHVLEWGPARNGGAPAGRRRRSADRDGNKKPQQPVQIAMKELREKKVPFIVRRYLPDGSFEDWRIQDLIIPDR
jgi:hypothetical protein